MDNDDVFLMLAAIKIMKKICIKYTKAPGSVCPSNCPLEDCLTNWDFVEPINWHDKDSSREA